MAGQRVYEDAEARVQRTSKSGRSLFLFATKVNADVVFKPDK
jgi:hypothetical protein